MAVSKKDIRRNAFSFEKFNKIAAGEGLRYLSLEFSELESDVNDFMKRYFQDFRDNKRTISDVDTLKIIHGALIRIKGYLDNYYKISKELFAKFKKSIIKHDRKKLVEIFGKDYMQYIEDIIPGKGLSEGPKYKAMMELVGGKDRELMERALNCLFEEPVEYGSKYQDIVLYFNKLFSGKEDAGTNYDWVGVYGDLFKFAKIPSYFDVRRLFPGKGQEVEFGFESLDISLTETEKRLLMEICDLWKTYKSALDKLLPLTERAYQIDKGYMLLEGQRNEGLHNIFDRLKALKYIVGSFISDGGSEKEFYERTGMTFKNAYAKIDNWVYILLKAFPSNVSNHIGKKFINKMPRTMVKDDVPVVEESSLMEPEVFTEKEEAFFDRGKQYEEGEISGTMEGPSEILYREKPERRLPVGGLSSYRGASNFTDAIQYMKKFAKK